MLINYLCVAYHADDFAVLFHGVEVIFNNTFAILICPTLGSLRESLFLGLAPLCTNQHGHGWWNRTENNGEAKSHQQWHAERRNGTLWVTPVRSVPHKLQILLNTGKFTNYNNYTNNSFKTYTSIKGQKPCYAKWYEQNFKHLWPVPNVVLLLCQTPIIFGPTVAWQQNSSGYRP